LHLFLVFVVVVGQADRGPAAKEVPAKEPYASAEV
jgi:hypothetical protein